LRAFKSWREVVTSSSRVVSWVRGGPLTFGFFWLSLVGWRSVSWFSFMCRHCRYVKWGGMDCTLSEYAKNYLNRTRPLMLEAYPTSQKYYLIMHNGAKSLCTMHYALWFDFSLPHSGTGPNVMHYEIYALWAYALWDSLLY
jgi:hypothetical protein